MTFRPIPTTSASSASGNRSTRIPPSLASSRLTTSFGHFNPSVMPVASRMPSTTAIPASSGNICQRGASGRAGRSSTEKVSAVPGGACQLRPRRPRPARWKSATTTRPSGSPVRAAAATSSLVDSVTGLATMRNIVGSDAAQHPPVISSKKREAVSSEKREAVPSEKREDSPETRESPAAADSPPAGEGDVTARSPGILQTGRYTVDAQQQKAQRTIALGLIRNSAAQGGERPQLQMGESVDVRVAQLHRLAEHAVRFEQSGGAENPEHPFDAPVVFGKDAVRDVRPIPQRKVALSDIAIRFRQRHLDIVDHGGEQRPLRVRRAKGVHIADGSETTADSVPAGQVHSRLRPGEIPRNRPQVRQIRAGGSPDRTRPDAQRTDFRQRRHGGKVFGKSRCLDETAIFGSRRPADGLKDRAVFPLRGCDPLHDSRC